MLTYDLATRFLPEDHKVWVLHAGRGKRQFKTFADNSLVFLEHPGFAAARDTFRSVEAIRRHLRMSDAFVRYLNAPDDTAPPSRTADHYLSSPEIGTGARSFNAAVGNISSLYSQAKPGDLILVPGRDQYAPVLAGELKSEFDPEHVISVRQFGDALLPYRPVNWIQKGVEKRKFSKDVARRLENRHAIISLSQRPHAEEVYKKIYGGFVYANISKTDFIGDRYDSKDPSGIIAAAKLVQFFSSLYVAFQKGEIESVHGMSVDEVIGSYPPEMLIRDFEINFSSPGKITLVVLAATMALTVALGVTAATDGISYQGMVDGIRYINSANPGGIMSEDQMEAVEMYRNILKAAGEDMFNNARPLAEQAENIDLKTPITKVP